MFILMREKIIVGNPLCGSDCQLSVALSPISGSLTMPDSNNYALDVVGILHRLLVCKIAAHKHSVQSVDSSEQMSAVYVQIVSFLVGFFKIRLQRY